MEGSHPLCHHRYSLHCPCADNANFSNGYTKSDGNEVKVGKEGREMKDEGRKNIDHQLIKFIIQ
jgi:hypothetical protein